MLGMVEVIQVEINGEYFDIWMNEEGKIDDSPKIASYNLGTDIIIGKILFARSSEGNMLELSEEDIKLIKDNHITIKYKIGDYDKDYTCLNRI